MAAENMISLLYLFLFLLFLIITFACCTVCVIPAGSISKSPNYLRRSRYRSYRRNTQGSEISNFGIISEETDGAATPMVVPPYPVEPLHPTPQAPPGPGFATTNPPYPTQNPHPLGGAAPYPPVAVPYPPSATYPPSVPVASTAPYPDYSAQPPSYSEAVAQPPVQPPLPHKEGYSKQSPYNPNY